MPPTRGLFQFDIKLFVILAFFVEIIRHTVHGHKLLSLKIKKGLHIAALFYEDIFSLFSTDRMNASIIVSASSSL